MHIVGLPELRVTKATLQVLDTIAARPHSWYPSINVACGDHLTSGMGEHMGEMLCGGRLTGFMTQVH
jgi:hypothetical protein